MKTRILFFILLYTLLHSFGNLLVAQTMGLTPYSRSGLGELALPSTVANFGMGSTSAANNSALNINLNNPASYNSLLLTTYEAGLMNTRVSSKFNSSSLNNSKTGFSYMALGMPVTKRWGLCLGIMPYSYNNYNVSTSVYDTNLDTVKYYYDGSGGINQVRLGNAFKVYKDSTKYLSVGVNVDYLFGQTYNQQRIEFKDLYALNSKSININSYNGFIWNAGIQYYQKINNKHALTIGFTGNTENKIASTNENIAIRYRYLDAAGSISHRDTFILKSNSAQAILPTTVSGGLSWGMLKTNSSIEKLRVSVDYLIQNWSSFQNAAITTPTTYANRSRISVGAQYMNQQKNNFWSNTRLRAGAYSEKSYLKYNGQALTDVGFTAGLGLPFKRISSTLNIGVQYGLRTNKVVNAKDRYTNIIIGFTLNDLWFIRPKVD